MCVCAGKPDSDLQEEDKPIDLLAKMQLAGLAVGEKPVEQEPCIPNLSSAGHFANALGKLEINRLSTGTIFEI